MKVYCNNCFWLQEYKLHGVSRIIVRECSLDVCFTKKTLVHDGPFEPVIEESIKRVNGVYGLNKYHTCPHFKKITKWQKVKRFFSIREPIYDLDYAKK